MRYISIYYSFKFNDDTEEVFHLKFDEENFELIENIPKEMPSWTKLTFHQCPHCPLDLQTHPYCPLAANMVNIVKKFEHLLPYDKVHLEVFTQERMISQDTRVQTGVSSLMGLVMATSGCPYTAFFRPMARFHQPLSTTEETIYRSISMYLMAQYLLYKAGREVDLDLKGLEKIYENIHIVNTSIAERLLAASKTDSSIDAIVQLDIYAQTFLGIPEEPLKDIRHLFVAYFTNNP